MLSYILSFVLLLYKLNVFNNINNFDNSKRIFEVIQLDDNMPKTPLVMLDYFSVTHSSKINRSNVIAFPLLMTTSFLLNKKERIDEENNTLYNVKQIIQLKKFSIAIAIFVFLVVSIEWNNLDIFSSGYQKGFFLTLPISTNSGVILAYDHLSIPFILLLSFIFPLVFISNWTTIKMGEIKYYLTTILASHYFLIIVFLVIDILMFYVSFEIILPFFFILLGMFGGVQKFRAMYYLFLYTLWGSLFMLIEFLTKIGENGTGVIGLLDDIQLSNSWSLLGTIAIILAFSVKTPIVPFHLWLPLAHGDANVSGSIVLASIVLKMALYGFIRILIFILVLSFATAQINMFFIFIFSIIFASTTTMRQNDLKVLVAYSSVAHMGSTLLGGFSNNHFGLFGSILFSVAHGVVSPALFIFVGALFYDRIGSRIINYLKGLLNIYPIAVAMLLTVIFGNMGTPLTANFIAELKCLLATFLINPGMAMIAALSVIFSAIYSIYMFNRISSGTISPLLMTAPDTYKREFSLLLPLITIMVLLGIFPILLSEPLDLGLSHFLLEPYSNPFILLFIFISLLNNFKKYFSMLSFNFFKLKSWFILIWSSVFSLNYRVNYIKFAGLNWFLCCFSSCKNKSHQKLNSPTNSASVSRRNSSENSNSNIESDNINSMTTSSNNLNTDNLSDINLKPTQDQLVQINNLMKWMNWQMKIISSRGGGSQDAANIVEEAYKRANKQGLNPKWLGLKAPSKPLDESTNIISEPIPSTSKYVNNSSPKLPEASTSINTSSNLNSNTLDNTKTNLSKVSHNDESVLIKEINNSLKNSESFIPKIDSSISSVNISIENSQLSFIDKNICPINLSNNYVYTSELNFYNCNMIDLSNQSYFDIFYNNYNHSIDYNHLSDYYNLSPFDIESNSFFNINYLIEFFSLVFFDIIPISYWIFISILLYSIYIHRVELILYLKYKYLNSPLKIKNLFQISIYLNILGIMIKKNIFENLYFKLMPYSLNNERVYTVNDDILDLLREWYPEHKKRNNKPQDIKLKRFVSNSKIKPFLPDDLLDILMDSESKYRKRNNKPQDSKPKKSEPNPKKKPILPDDHNKHKDIGKIKNNNNSLPKNNGLNNSKVNK